MCLCGEGLSEKKDTRKVKGSEGGKKIKKLKFPKYCFKNA
jgi:hypothetical protein